MGPHRSPLDSPAVGTARDDLIAPCRTTTPAPAPPPPPDVLPAFAVALSGGGFRASLAGMGVLRFLADAGLLGRVRYASSVSGGSITNGLLAAGWGQLDAGGFDGAAFDRAVLEPLRARISAESLRTTLLRNLWRAIGPRSRTDVLAHALDDWLFGGMELEDIPPPCRFVFNAANLSTGVRFGSERDVVGDYVMGRATTAGTGLRVATAVAASAAVPGAFAALPLPDLKLPCAQGRVAWLVDGGAYDNMGLEPLDALGDDVCLVALNAGGTFRTGPVAGLPVIRDLQRANSLLYRQTTALRTRDMVERFQALERAEAEGTPPPPWGRRGVLFGLATRAEATGEWVDGRPEAPPWMPGADPAAWRTDVALIETSFNRFDAERCRQLVYRGWWLAGATLSRYHRGLLPAALPAWRDLP